MSETLIEMIVLLHLSAFFLLYTFGYVHDLIFWLCKKKYEHERTKLNKKRL